MTEPVVIATWKFGAVAAREAWPLLRQGGAALDAAVAGAQAVEDDPVVDSVGYGGLPNRAGTVQLDAAVMDGRTLGCGGVAGVENVRHVAALARLVMEKTPHTLLVGEGARLFAVEQGFRLECLLTPEALAEWERRRARKAADPAARLPLTHDTVTVLTLDTAGSLAAACTTSGLSHKLPGRVGDSPIVGAGLYADNDAGAAGGTGVGEEIYRVGGSLLIVEAMRGGASPQQACETAVRRVNAVAARRGVAPAHVALIALDPRGRVGAACTVGTNFHYAVGRSETIEVLRGAEIGDV